MTAFLEHLKILKFSISSSLKLTKFHKCTTIGYKLKKVLQENAVTNELTETDVDDLESDFSSLTVPVISLSIIIIITLSLAIFRLFYTRFYKDKEEITSRYIFMIKIHYLCFEIFSELTPEQEPTEAAAAGEAQDTEEMMNQTGGKKRELRRRFRG